MTAKMATMFGDVTGLQQRHHFKKKPNFVEKIKGFPLRAKSFRNTSTYQKVRGRVLSPPSPLTLYHGEDMTLRVRPRVNE